MSTTTRKKGAASRGSAVSTLDQFRDMIASARDVLDTKNGHYLVFAAKFLLSLLTLLYFKGVLRLAYYSMFYRLDIPEDKSGIYCFLVSMVCIFFGAVMLFTRKQIVTRIVIMISMPFYLPIILFNYRHLVLLIPLGLMIAITYLGSGTKEGPKTIFGAVFIMIYILGAFVFLTVQSILQPAAEEAVVARDVTPGGQYRFSVVQMIDQADGNTYVSVEPNTADITYKHSTWYAKGYSREVYQERPLGKIEYKWETQTRADITKELITNNPNITFTLNAKQMKLLGLDVGYAEEKTIGELSRSQRHKLGYGSTDDPIDSRFAKFFRVSLMEPDFAVTLNFDKMVEIGLDPTYDLRLSHMTDENLAALGVPRENEVLKVNGKVVFRQYVAELERTFWESSRDMTAFLESNDVPEVNPEGVEIPERPASTSTTTAVRTTARQTETTTDETTTDQENN
ncbi:MAG TPA: hypothetical protein DCG49_04525 [Ruminococcus sp.]|nr:hypothetical protein [Ruminococcus sp.]